MYMWLFLSLLHGFPAVETENKWWSLVSGDGGAGVQGAVAGAGTGNMLAVAGGSGGVVASGSGARGAGSGGVVVAGVASGSASGGVQWYRLPADLEACKHRYCRL